MAYLATKASVSVVTVNFNNLLGLRNTLQSVQLQLARGAIIEQIVVDGGSVDGSQDFLLLNRRMINQLIVERDRGIYDAMNKGLDAASSDCVIFLNSGDTFFGQFDLSRFQRKYPLASKAVICRTIQVFNGDAYIRDSLRARYRDPLLSPHQGIFVPRPLYKSFRYDERFLISADRIWIARVVQKEPPILAEEICSVLRLGGISNQATIKQFLLTLGEPGTWTSKLKLLPKICLRTLFGQRTLYRILAFRKYDRLPKAFLSDLDNPNLSYYSQGENRSLLWVTHK